MNTTMFQYNQQLATEIGGGGQYVTKSGGYDLKVVRAQFTENKFLELDFETRDGLKLNYVSINHTKNDGQPNDYGQKMIHAIMGCTGAQSLTCDQNGNCPELFGKFLKAVVQRVDYTKQSGANAGQDGYRFEFKMPASINTSQTVKELVEGLPAEAYQKYADSVQDKDDRQPQGHQTPQGNQSPEDDFPL